MKHRWLCIILVGLSLIPIDAGPQPQPHSGAEVICYDSSQPKPNITLYDLGGTITGYAASPDELTNYITGERDIKAVIIKTPEICKAANIRRVSIAKVDSINLGLEHRERLSILIQDDLDSPFTQGAVVSHGTDTLDETAFFLDLTVMSEKPLIITGAMRPMTAISGDGQGNLYAAVVLAMDKKAWGRGVMISFSDHILAPRYTRKFNSNQVNSFEAREAGNLGAIVNFRPLFYYPPSRPIGHRYFNISHRSPNSKWPRVAERYAGRDDAMDLQRDIDRGAQGFLIIGFGGGYLPTANKEEIRKTLNGTGIPVVVSSRVPGFVVAHGMDDGIGAGLLSPSNARMLFILCLSMNLSTEAIRDVFEPDAIY